MCNLYTIIGILSDFKKNLTHLAIANHKLICYIKLSAVRKIIATPYGKESVTTNDPTACECETLYLT
jgi:hypothetical protein